MRAFAGAVLGVMVVGLAADAGADSLSDLMGPREIAVGEGLRGSATGRSAIGLNPAGLPLNRELVFEGGYGYRGTDDATLIGASACDSTTQMPGCFFYEYMGASPVLDGGTGMTGTRRTHVGGMALSRPLLPRISIGSTVKYYDFNTDMAGEDEASGFTWDVGTTIRVSEMINLGFSAQNLFATNRSDQFPRALGGGVFARPIPLLSLGFDMRWRMPDAASAPNTLRYGGGAELFLRPGSSLGLPIRIGGLRDNGLETTYISGGLGLAGMKWGLDVTARRAVKGDDDTLVIASMRFYGPRMAAPGLDSSFE